VKRLDNECLNRQRSSNHEKDENISKKKHSRRQQSIELNESSHRKQIHSDLNRNISSSNSSSSSSRWSINQILIPFCLIT